jgi:hypothetical protein
MFDLNCISSALTSGELLTSYHRSLRRLSHFKNCHTRPFIPAMVYDESALPEINVDNVRDIRVDMFWSLHLCALQN